jgi:uncharacterized protein with FMN-binding domain
MNKKNLTVITFITLFGLGLFVIIYNILITQAGLSNVNSEPKSNQENASLPTVIMEALKPVNQINPPSITTNTPLTQAVDETQLQSSETSISPKTTNVYKDGNYSFSLSYRVPEGNTEKITTLVTLSKDTVTAIKNTNTATNRTSKEYQNNFESKIQAAAIGKKIDSLNLDAVGGASLTTDAFMKAVREVRSQAKS